MPSYNQNQLYFIQNVYLENLGEGNNKVLYITLITLACVLILALIVIAIKAPWIVKFYIFNF